MEDLRRRIDELAARECLPWQRDGNRVRISLSRSGRSQIVRLARRKDRYVFSSVVAHASAVNEDRRSLAFRIWRRNALKAVVTFTIDRRERVIGLIDQPIESLHSKELEFYLETLARECDQVRVHSDRSGQAVKPAGRLRGRWWAICPR